MKQAEWKNSVDVDEVSIADHQNLFPLIETVYTEAFRDFAERDVAVARSIILVKDNIIV